MISDIDSSDSYVSVLVVVQVGSAGRPLFAQPAGQAGTSHSPDGASAAALSLHSPPS